MSVPSWVPVVIYASLALGFLLLARRARAVKCVLVATHCGVIVLSFTGGASGGVWLAQLFLLLVSPIVIFGKAVPALQSKTVTRLTFAMFVLFFAGILVGLGRFDSTVESLKAGSFTTILGIPTRILMAGYRTWLLCSLLLAFALPLRYRIDRPVLIDCLKLTWFFSMALAIFGVLDYLSIANLGFSYREQAGYTHVSVLGFQRAALGMMSVAGIFFSMMLTQVSRRPQRALLVYTSAPLLLLALLFTWSRAALLALAVGGFSLMFTLGWSRAWKGAVLTLAGIAAAVVFLLQFPDLQERFSLPGEGLTVEETSAGRLPAWAELIAWLVKRPDVLVFGVGFLNFHYYVNLSAGAVTLEAAHNNFLHILTEAGIGGLMLFLAWLISIFGWLWAWRRSAKDPGVRWTDDQTGQSAAGILFSLMIAVVVSCLTQESLTPSTAMAPFLLHFYLFLGIVVSFYRNEAAEKTR